MDEEKSLRDVSQPDVSGKVVRKLGAFVIRFNA
jgi:hypothetical protein